MKKPASVRLKQAFSRDGFKLQRDQESNGICLFELSSHPVLDPFGIGVNVFFDGFFIGALVGFQHDRFELIQGHEHPGEELKHLIGHETS